MGACNTLIDDDFKSPNPDQDDSMLASTKFANFTIKKTLVDQGSSVNIIYYKTFVKLGIFEDLITSYSKQIVGFSSERVDTRGYMDLSEVP